MDQRLHLHRLEPLSIKMRIYCHAVSTNDSIERTLNDFTDFVIPDWYWMLNPFSFKDVSEENLTYKALPVEANDDPVAICPVNSPID